MPASIKNLLIILMIIFAPLFMARPVMAAPQNDPATYRLSAPAMGNAPDFDVSATHADRVLNQAVADCTAATVKVNKIKNPRHMPPEHPTFVLQCAGNPTVALEKGQSVWVVARIQLQAEADTKAQAAEQSALKSAWLLGANVQAQADNKVFSALQSAYVNLAKEDGLKSWIGGIALILLVAALVGILLWLASKADKPQRPGMNPLGGKDETPAPAPAPKPAPTGAQKA